MEDIIKEYFMQMLENNINIEDAEDELMDLVAEIANEIKED